jgi:hypothetical protein
MMVRFTRPTPPDREQREPDWRYRDPDYPRDGGFMPPTDEARLGVAIRRKLDRIVDEQRVLNSLVRSLIYFTAAILGFVGGTSLLILAARL